MMKKHFLLSAILFILLFFNEVQAGDTQVDSTNRQVKLSADTVSNTLQKLSSLFNVSIVAETNTVVNVHHDAIEGWYSLDSLLNALLSHHNIGFRRVKNGVVLSPISPDTLASIAIDKYENTIDNIVVLAPALHTHHHPTLSANRTHLNKAQKSQYATDYIGEYMDFGAFSALPNHNIAEALGYLPGVSVGRLFGEGLTINARGLGPLYQLTSLNGHLLAINENVRNSGQSGRAFRFDVLPVQNVAEVNIVKSPTANRADTGIASTVAIQTFKPLAFEHSNTSGSIELETVELSKSPAPQFSVINNWLNTSKTLGVVGTLSYSQRKIRQDNFQTWDWELNGNSYFLDGLSSNILIPSNRLALTVEQERRENVSLGLSTQWQPSNTLSLSTDHFFSQLTSDFDEQRILARLDSATAMSRHTVVENHVLKGATFDQLGIKTAYETSLQTHLNYIGLAEADWYWQKWQVSFSAAYTLADSFTDQPIRRTRYQLQPQPFSFSVGSASSSQLAFNLDNRPWQVSVFDGLEHLSARNISVDEKGVSVNIDLIRQLDHWLFKDIFVGNQWRRGDRQYIRQDKSISEAELGSVSLGENSFLPTTQLSLSHILPNSGGHQWWSPNHSEQLQFASQLRFSEMTQSDLANSYHLMEEVTSRYVRMDYVLDKENTLSGNVGLKWWQWQTEIGGIDAPEEHRNEYRDWLPSFTFNARFSSQWQFKFSVAETVSLPSYSDLNPSVTLNSTEGVLLARGGNPNLMPSKAKQWDTGLYWYFADQAQLSLGYFQKEIDDFIGREVRLATFNDLLYRFTQAVNVGRAQVDGIEIGYSQNFPLGFGLQSNLTLLESQSLSSNWAMARDNRLEGVSEVGLNLLAFYELAPWIVRIGMDYRGEYLENLSVTDVPSTWLDSQRTLKFQVGYQLTDNIQLSLSGRNLLSKPTRFYFKTGGQDVVKHIIENDHAFSLGIKFSL